MLTNIQSQNAIGCSHRQGDSTPHPWLQSKESTPIRMLRKPLVSAILLQVRHGVSPHRSYYHVNHSQLVANPMPRIRQKQQQRSTTPHKSSYHTQSIVRQSPALSTPWTVDLLDHRPSSTRASASRGRQSLPLPRNHAAAFTFVHAQTPTKTYLTRWVRTAHQTHTPNTSEQCGR